MNPAERPAIDSFISRDPALRDVEWLMRRGDASAHVDQNDVRRAWKELRIRMVANETSTALRLMSPDSEAAPNAPPRAPSLSRGFRLPSMRTRVSSGVFAGVVGVLLMGVVWAYRGHTEKVLPSVHEMATQVGQQASIRLTDGTVVTIGPLSRLRVSGDFGTNNRTVVLDGEALFEVSSNAKIPFIVSTQQSVVRVLGTKFNVNSFGDTTTVAVVDGKVSLESADHTAPGVVVMAGYIGRFTAAGDVSLLRDDVMPYVSWVNRRFVYRDERMSTVLNHLSRWYGVHFTVDDSSFFQRTITADWDNRSFESVLQSLRTAFHLKYEREGEDVKLFTKDPDSYLRRSQK